MRVPKGEYIDVPDAGPVVPWKAIEKYHDVIEQADFRVWMRGQTCVPEGIFADDYERWLRTL